MSNKIYAYGVNLNKGRTFDKETTIHFRFDTLKEAKEKFETVDLKDYPGYTKVILFRLGTESNSTIKTR